MQFGRKHLPLFRVKVVGGWSGFVGIGDDDEAIVIDRLDVDAEKFVGSRFVGLAGRGHHGVVSFVAGVGRKIVAAGRAQVKACC